MAAFVFHISERMAIASGRVAAAAEAGGGGGGGGGTDIVLVFKFMNINKYDKSFILLWSSNIHN
jgi:hypothetical protein